MHDTAPHAGLESLFGECTEAGVRRGRHASLIFPDRFRLLMVWHVSQLPRSPIAHYWLEPRFCSNNAVFLGPSLAGERTLHSLGDLACSPCSLPSDFSIAQAPCFSSSAILTLFFSRKPHGSTTATSYVFLVSCSSSFQLTALLPSTHG